MANKLIARLCLMYGSPESENLPAFFAEMDRLVANYSERELEKAADLILRSHRGRSFPSVSEVLTACAHARDILPEQKGVEDMTPEKADWIARKIVNGLRLHGHSGKMEPASGEFSDSLLSHPIVRQSVTEGWGRELRLFLIHHVRRHIMAKQPFTSIDQFMPPAKWIEDTRKQNERFAKAREWQKQNLPPSTDFEAALQRMLANLQSREAAE